MPEADPENKPLTLERMPLVSNPISHPAHYRRFPVECISFTRNMTFLGGNVFKYAYRHRDKGSEVEDLKKCQQYLTWVQEYGDPIFSPPARAQSCRTLWDTLVAPRLPREAPQGSSEGVWGAMRALMEGEVTPLAAALQARLDVLAL